MGYDEALTKCGGSCDRLEEAVRSKRVLTRQKDGLTIYFFPRWDFERFKDFSMRLMQGRKRQLLMILGQRHCRADLAAIGSPVSGPWA